MPLRRIHPLAMLLLLSRPAWAALLGVAALMLGVVPVLAQGTSPDDKPVIQTQADLPRHTYDLPTETASALLTDEAAFDDVAARVRADVETLLDAYVIEDRATQRGLHDVLVRLSLLRGDYAAAREHTDRVRSLEEKPAVRLIYGLLNDAVVAAAQAGEDEAARREAFRTAYAAATNALPWEIVQDEIENFKGQVETFTPNLLVGLAQSQYDPAASETGEISSDVAHDLIMMREFIGVVYPYKETVVEVLQAYIDANRTEKPDIWAERDIALTDADGLHPVVIAIWDSGVDPAVFGEAMFRNEAETANGRDDDGNGFVDDVYGIGFGLWGIEPTTEPLFPLDEAVRARLPENQDLMKGFTDIQASVDSPEAQALKRQMAAMQPAEVKPFLEELGQFNQYIHGTHVAGIAAAGNPAARLLIVRVTFPHQMVPPPMGMEEAVQWAANLQRSVNYLKQHGARVVTMSWGFSAKSFERLYEMNGIGENAEERQRMAQEVFGVLVDGMREAMESAPGVLFVPAAGNSDEDVGFVEAVPSSIELPNVLTVGAVDQAGDETSFTSYGRVVRAHANGFEVESYLPGGERMPLSGTSMAAPNAANLAAKLIALDPSLTPEEVVDLILEGADRTEDGRRVLINPKRSVELLRGRR